MERVINTKFFTFGQNNSGGYYIVNDDVAAFLIIEAQNANEAISKMEDITEDYSQFCSCCGQRWSSWMDDSDGTEEPMVYEAKIKVEKLKGWMSTSTIIYYYDGTKEKLWYNKAEENDED